MMKFNGASVYADPVTGEIIIRLFDSFDSSVKGELRFEWDDARHLAGIITKILDEETPF
jgi:hypothetical protein